MKMEHAKTRLVVQSPTLGRYVDQRSDDNRSHEIWQMYTVEAGEQIPASASVVAEAGDLNVDAYINAQNRVWRTIDTSRIKVPKCPW